MKYWISLARPTEYSPLPQPSSRLQDYHFKEISVPLKEINHYYFSLVG
jgi:hypothetical protein